MGIRHRKLFDKTHPGYKYFNAVYPTDSNTDDLAGIWQDVFLQAVPPARITNVFAKPDVEKDQLDFDIEIVNEGTSEKNITVNTSIREWLNHSAKNTAEIAWSLGKRSCYCPKQQSCSAPGERKKITVSAAVGSHLKSWFRQLKLKNQRNQRNQSNPVLEKIPMQEKSPKKIWLPG